MRKKFIITSICLVLMAFMILIFSMAVPMANQNYVVKTCVDKYTTGGDSPAVVAIVVENYQDRNIGRIAIRSYRMSHYDPDSGLIEREDHFINSYDVDGKVSSETINIYENGVLASITETSEITYDTTLGPYRGPRVRNLLSHSSVTLAQFEITVPTAGSVVTIEDVKVAYVGRDGTLGRVIGKTDGASIVSETW